MRSRKTRLAVIIDILTHNNISCQEELSKQLAVKGFIVTQATLSRDLKKLKTTKIANDLGGYRYVIPSVQLSNSNANTPATEEIVAPSLPPMATIQSAAHMAALSLRISGNVVVIKTLNGYASGLAYDLDMLHSPLILGTIPGADTVFVVVEEKASRQELFSLLTTFLPTGVIEEALPYFS